MYLRERADFLAYRRIVPGCDLSSPQQKTKGWRAATATIATVCIMPERRNCRSRKSRHFSLLRIRSEFRGNRVIPHTLGDPPPTLYHCLSLVVEFDTARVLNPAAGSLFGVVAEITPRDPESQAMTPPRFDWVGKPEQTNFRLNGAPDAPDVRDAWNQETPFAIGADMLPVFRKRLTDSFRIWDLRDGKVDWEPAALAANVNVFLEDYLLIDVAKPTTDRSHLEIERELIVDEESRRCAFFGDATALDRLAALSLELLARQALAPTTHLIAADVASIRHHFAQADAHLGKAEALGAPQDALARLRLTLDQALGENLSATLKARRERAEASGAIQDLVPLGALLANLGEFEEADRTYVSAIQRYRDLSPFPLAWACFQLGVLWGEAVPRPDLLRAERWYSQAIAYLPAYTHARVHLAEICLEAGEFANAEALLRPVLESGDPEVQWQLAKALAAEARDDEAARQCEAAREAFEGLLARHELAFADHAVEFYMSIGDDAARACDLARINLANRPTLRAFELAQKAALASAEAAFADELAFRARAQWGRTKMFGFSPLAEANKGVRA
jgi:hypothetical protein